MLLRHISAGAAMLGLSLFALPAFPAVAAVNKVGVAKPETGQREVILVRRHKRGSGGRLHGFAHRSYIADPGYFRRGFAGYR
jgi:hypothetical protein